MKIRTTLFLLTLLFSLSVTQARFYQTLSKEKIEKFLSNDGSFQQNVIEKGTRGTVSTFAFLMTIKPLVSYLAKNNLASPFAQKITTLKGASAFSLAMGLGLMACELPNIYENRWWGEPLDKFVTESIKGPLLTTLILAPQKVRIILAACLTGLVIKAID